MAVEPMAGQPAAHCEDLVKVFRSATGETHALRGIGLEMRPGSLTVVAGPSGSGKSSLLTMLAARDRPSAGTLSVLGRDVGVASTRDLRGLRRRRIGFVPQRSATAVFPHLRAVDQVRQVAAWRGARGRARAQDALAAVGLSERADHLPAALSGGEQQRLAVAIALVGSPELVVADEPTAELDHANADLVLAALLDAAAAGAAVVISSHDERILHRGDRLLRLRHGVLSSETTLRDTTAVIDATGRLQLPPDLLVRFPSRRVVIEDDGGVVRLRAPEEES
ncbi:ATP-binding cassette domain-containing protein [Nocardioides sp. MAH-18]|uniref:ATP-binding cassette domain-containing protein n=1 Tax=Nocardioides agri TaxID=2682843 RepID=A0A6L6XU69_9ACTN|nr:ATP-binding cassette domain-containing protein [Nocardioides sp. CGMCC 1.13656]MBA2956108.1 ATP-binding cassette domain-containing protein [Nocardioides sp. CGMCC 1.13656]MVQ50954.1 ATP-binding cassette domain-containing protein [Nocardioides sp. MAH-18]